MDQYVKPQIGWKCDVYKNCVICGETKYFRLFPHHGSGRALWARKNTCWGCTTKERNLKHSTNTIKI